jgi:hypothetical protein
LPASSLWYPWSMRTCNIIQVKTCYNKISNLTLQKKITAIGMLMLFELQELNMIINSEQVWIW